MIIFITCIMMEIFLNDTVLKIFLYSFVVRGSLCFRYQGYLTIWMSLYKKILWYEIPNFYCIWFSLSAPIWWSQRDPNRIISGWWSLTTHFKLFYGFVTWFSCLSSFPHVISMSLSKHMLWSDSVYRWLLWWFCTGFVSWGVVTWKYGT